MKVKHLIISAATIDTIYGQEKSINEIEPYPELDFDILHQLVTLVDQTETKDATADKTDIKPKIW